MIQDNLRKKIEHLIAKGGKLSSAQITDRTEEFFAECESFLIESSNAVDLAIHIEKNAYKEKIKSLSSLNRLDNIRSISAIFKALLSDMDNGLIADFGNAIRAETFSDFLGHAADYHKAGEKQAAGVLAGVVFEDTIRRICTSRGIGESGRKLEELINDLSRQSVISPLQSKQAKVASHVRTKATHAQWSEFDLDGVSNTIDICRRLLQDHLGA